MKTISIVFFSAFVLMLISCEKEEIIETEVLKFEVNPEHTQAPSYVDVVYHVQGVNQIIIQHNDVVFNGDSISQINISGKVSQDTIRLFYDKSGDYSIVFKAQGNGTFEIPESFSLTPSNKELLVDKKWQLSSFVATKPDGSMNDIYAYLFDYNKDDFYVFAANGDYTRNEGASRENSSDPNIVAQGTWSFTNSIRFDSLEYTATDKLGEYTTLWQSLEVSENAFTCQRIDGEPGNQTVNSIEFKLLEE